MRYDATANAVEATGLVKRFRKTLALDRVDLAVRPGPRTRPARAERCGQDHLVRILATLLGRTRDTPGYSGYDVVREADAGTSLIGLTGQSAPSTTT